MDNIKLDLTKYDIEELFKGVYGPTTFEELDLVEEYKRLARMFYKRVEQFVDLAYNIIDENYYNSMGQPDILSTQIGLAELSMDFFNLMLTADSLESSVKSFNYISDNLIVKKDTEDDSLRWVGVMTNKYIDRHDEIIATKAHKAYVSSVQNGEYDYPVLLFKHFPIVIGQTDWIAFDDEGFVVVSGTVYPMYENFVTKMLNTYDIGMSHGARFETIERDVLEPHIITKYRSHEVTMLPQNEAANILTAFVAVNEE